MSSSSTSSSSTSSPSPSLLQMPGVSPAWAQPPRLLQAGVANFRVLTDLLVDLSVDKRACPAPNVLSNVYRGDMAQKCAAAAALLGDSKMGFGIKPPVLPRALLASDAAQRAKWLAPQQAWYNQLVEHARALSDCIRESRSTWEQHSAALITVFKLINVEEVTKLWPEQQEKTSTWKDLLTPTTAILHSGPREERQKLHVVPQHTYRLRLACVNAEVSFVVACYIANYALLPREEEKKYASLRVILAGDGKVKASAAEAETSASESSSDGESDWQIKKSRRDAARQRKRAAGRSKQLAAFAAKELSGDRFTTDSADPLLQLATRVTTLRSWHHLPRVFRLQLGDRRLRGQLRDGGGVVPPRRDRAARAAGPVCRPLVPAAAGRRYAGEPLRARGCP